jgi:hypothetical protein
MRSRDSRLSRRSWLAATGAALAGCQGDDGDGSEQSPSNRADTATTTRPAPTDGHTIYVSPEGDDDTGTGSAKNPWRTVRRARDHLRERDLSAIDAPRVTVILRPGQYPVREPIRFGPQDSGTAATPIVYRGPSSGSAVVDGGREIDGWEQTTINNTDAWKTVVPDVRAGDWYFRQLWVDGERRRRSILPQETRAAFRDGTAHTQDEWGLYDVTDGDVGDSEFTFAVEDGAIDPGWHNFQDVELVLLDRWMDEHGHLVSFDPDSNVVELSNRTFTAFPEEHFYVTNVKEAVTEPGQWYLDRETGELFYVPYPDESMSDVTVVAPFADRLVDIGGPDGGESPVEHLYFRSLDFGHTTWSFQPTNTSDSQAEDVPAVVRYRGARECRVQECTFRNLGTYALEFERACRFNQVAGNEFVDVGAGAVQVGQHTDRVSSAAITETPEWQRNRGNQFVDNHVHRFGRVFHRGVGFLVENVQEVLVAHNHVHDGYHSGVTAGGSMNYVDTVDRDFRFAHNHIHDLGKGLLSDFGGIYTRGRHPRTTVEHNYIHDITVYDSPGNGLYSDLGDTGTLFRDNVVHDVQNGYLMHYGHDVTLENNVFARARSTLILYSRRTQPTEDEAALRVRNNVLAAWDSATYATGYGRPVTGPSLVANHNLLWNFDGPVRIGGESREKQLDVQAWRSAGFDRESVVADPEFEDPAANDFDVRQGSPATEAPVDFDPIDLSDVGQRDRSPPPWPVASTATLAADGTVTIDWDAVVGADHYVVHRTGPEDAATERTTADTTYEEVPAEDGHYEYRLRSVADGVASAPTPPLTVHTNPAPSGLSVDVDRSRRITLSWDETAVADRYAVLRATTPEGPYDRVTTVDAPPFRPDSPAETAYYAVVGVSRNRTSPRSDPVEVGPIALLEGLESWYRLEAVPPVDRRGSGPDVRTTGNPQKASGRIDRCVAFDGDDSIVLGDAARFEPSFPLSLSLWFAASDVDGKYVRLLDNGCNVRGDFSGYSLMFRDGEHLEALYGSSESATQHTVSTEAYDDGEWHHVAFVLDSGRQDLYVDGDRVASGSVKHAIAYDDQPLRLGAISTGDRQYFTGRLDDFRIYDRALSALEIAALSNPAYQ